MKRPASLRSSYEGQTLKAKPSAISTQLSAKRFEVTFRARANACPPSGSSTTLNGIIFGRVIMAEKKEITLRATLRAGRGKNDARRARREGQVPVTIYGGEGETVAALASLGELAAILRSDTGRNTIFTIDVDGVGASEVMFVDRQIDPVRMRLIHADFKRLVKGEKIEATVPLRLVGEPIGVREQQGVLEQIVREIEIRCEPREIPEALEVDVTNLA